MNYKVSLKQLLEILTSLSPSSSNYFRARLPPPDVATWNVFPWHPTFPRVSSLSTVLHHHPTFQNSVVSFPSKFYVNYLMACVLKWISPLISASLNFNSVTDTLKRFWNMDRPFWTGQQFGWVKRGFRDIFGGIWGRFGSGMYFNLFLGISSNWKFSFSTDIRREWHHRGDHAQKMKWLCIFDHFKFQSNNRYVFFIHWMCRNIQNIPVY